MPNAFVYAYYNGQQPTIVSTKYEPLLHPELKFGNDKLSNSDIDNHNRSTGSSQMLPYQVRCMKLLRYISPILYQFYAYQQYKHKYNYSGMIIIEARRNDKLQDLVPNCKPKMGINLCDDKVLSILYLSDAKMIKLYWQAVGLEKKNIDAYLKTVRMIQNDPEIITNTWSKWSECSRSCGGCGKQTRTRNLEKQVPGS